MSKSASFSEALINWITFTN